MTPPPALLAVARGPFYFLLTLLDPLQCSLHAPCYTPLHAPHGDARNLSLLQGLVQEGKVKCLVEWDSVQKGCCQALQDSKDGKEDPVNEPRCRLPSHGSPKAHGRGVNEPDKGGKGRDVQNGHVRVEEVAATDAIGRWHAWPSETTGCRDLPSTAGRRPPVGRDASSHRPSACRYCPPCPPSGGTAVSRSPAKRCGRPAAAGTLPRRPLPQDVGSPTPPPALVWLPPLLSGTRASFP